MCVCVCVCYSLLLLLYSEHFVPFCSFQLPHSTAGLYSCKVGTTKSQTLIDGGGAAVGGATGTYVSQKFFAGHSGGLRADVV